jgi:hypothetical protein
MNGIRQSTRSLINRVCLFALSNVIALFAAQSVVAQASPTPVRPPSDVKVINTTADPVPVTGTINVGNLGTSPLPVQVVNASGQPATVTGTVNVTNAGNGPLIVREAARVPFQHALNLTMNAGESFSFAQVAIPAGKLLVVEYVSGLATLPSGQQMKWLYINTAPTSLFEHILPFNLQSASQIFIASGPVRMYLMGGLEIGVARNGTAGSAPVEASITGYLVDAP